MNVRRLIPTAATAGAVTLGLLALSACSSSDTAGGKGDGRLAVTASFYPMQFLVQQIGGDHVSVTTLTKPGTEPHDLELSPRETARLSQADVVLYLKGIAPAVDDAIGQSGARQIVDATSLTTMERHGTEAGHGHEGDDDHGDEESAGGNDPHIWLDPVKYAEVAKGVGAALEKADPDHAATYRTNTGTLVGKLGALDTAFEQGLAHTTTRTFITTHAAFGYLAERYGLEQEAIAGVDPEAEPSPARVKELGTIARQDKVSTVFFETLASDRTAKTIAGDTGLRTDVLDPLEGITAKSKGSDYLQVMKANLAALRNALGAK
ncbi:metal ABC transporter substrate-binding protein [Streptomyces sp. NBC_01317]|uniref:metal ABC transporter substrate-binding protein n=1 Tax=Streptomyces sp. NBC_01317 TaxID=2903822 RepID=UPI002E0E58BD|nr:metal ABC transporter substrate-binding protein [Streptomyces sp. NBC_01317]